MSGYGSLQRRDQQVAEQLNADRDLMCAAQGCPHRWSVDAGNGRLCSWHAWSEPSQWPRITQEQLDAMADRAQRAQNHKPQPVKTMTKAEKIETLKALAAASVPQAGRKDWAFRIVKQAKDGRRFSQLVLKMAQAVTAKSQKKVIEE